MKNILVLVLSLAVFSVLAEPTIMPIVFNNPGMSIASACDEFHGDANCQCWESVFNPCCPWWEPEKCPPPINQHKKAVAKAAGDYFTNAETFFIVFGIPTCAAALIVPCATAGALAFYANRLAGEQYRIANDPRFMFVIGPDPDYRSPAVLSIPSAEIAYTGNPYVDNLIYGTTVIAGYGALIETSANRVSLCDNAGEDCGDMHQAMVDEGFRQFGAWFYEGAINLNGVAWELENQGADGDLVWMLRDMARVSAWAGQEYWQ